MIEATIIKYLNDNLDVPCYAEHQANEPASFCIIEKTGSSEVDFIEQATIAIQSYGSSLLEACKLNDQVKQTMRNIVALNEISDCSLNSDYNYTDQDTKRYRYQAIFNVIGE